ncbi:hypothetical protein CC78DRAFT_622391 [Lojkania enalia]|uniref:Uncharacterized protein n=1 Tax=Lojkania enalia TaxID=147567 RepID=A0A9P4JVJ1_9PLEO|nr:hypothetical protein CC78DRAFT_622391 [Didymosphaeria enalia]
MWTPASELQRISLHHTKVVEVRVRIHNSVVLLPCPRTTLRLATQARHRPPAANDITRFITTKREACYVKAQSTLQDLGRDSALLGHAFIIIHRDDRAGECHTQDEARCFRNPQIQLERWQGRLSRNLKMTMGRTIWEKEALEAQRKAQLNITPEICNCSDEILSN